MRPEVAAAFHCELRVTFTLPGLQRLESHSERSSDDGRQLKGEWPHRERYHVTVSEENAPATAQALRAAAGEIERVAAVRRGDPVESQVERDAAEGRVLRRLDEYITRYSRGAVLEISTQGGDGVAARLDRGPWHADNDAAKVITAVLNAAHAPEVGE